MRLAIHHSLHLALAGSLLLASVGCRGGSDSPASDGEQAFQKNKLSEVSEIIHTHTSTANSPPRSIKDLAKYQNGWPAGYKAVESGDIVVEWGAKIDPSHSGSILAFDKAAPDSGGFVLMQDGRTIKHLSKAEFQAASKAVK